MKKVSDGQIMEFSIEGSWGTSTRGCIRLHIFVTDQPTTPPDNYVLIALSHFPSSVQPSFLSVSHLHFLQTYHDNLAATRIGGGESALHRSD